MQHELDLSITVEFIFRAIKLASILWDDISSISSVVGILFILLVLDFVRCALVLTGFLRFAMLLWRIAPSTSAVLMAVLARRVLYLWK